MPSNSDPISKIIVEFRDAWETEGRPWILDFLKRFADEDQHDLVQALIPIDIEYRQKNDDEPRPHDYLQLGHRAVIVAFRALKKPSAKDTHRAVEETQIHDSKTPASLDETMAPSDEKNESSTEDFLAEYIGPFRLIRKIGEGGMGTVWEAEQEKPVSRRVALKLIRTDMNSKGAIARFEAERQVIAMMNHPNIAGILDAGKTNYGSPYFVMELVNGIPLNLFSDQNQLTIRQRLELMIPICRAVQHAHQKGIIHRDLKHSNTLVTQTDDGPIPKVIDFGLAKALKREEMITGNSLNTEYGRIVGTLQYMSPEQADVDESNVDTRSDIYSLGVMLYKLLVGTTPIENDTVSGKSLVRVLESIRKVEPHRPSERLATMPESRMSAVCQQRQIHSEKLQPMLRGELDWIVMKAIDKDRERRYDSANDLARDLERFLADEEVVARPASAFYKATKFVKRNKSFVASAILASMLLIAGVLGTSYGLFRAIKERDRANNKSILAETEAEKARKSEREVRQLQATSEAQLRATRIKSAWSDWKLGNIESAWETLNNLPPEDQSWEAKFLRTTFSSSEDTLFGHASYVNFLDVSGDHKWIASSSHDNTVKIWDADQHELMFTFMTDDLPTGVAFSVDSKLVACSDLSNRIQIWDARNGKLLRTIGPMAADIKSILFSAKGESLIVSVGKSDTIKDGRSRKTIDQVQPKILILDHLNAIAKKDSATSHSIKTTLSGFDAEIKSLGCTSDENIIIGCGEKDRKIYTWKRVDGEFKMSAIDSGHTKDVTGLAISADNQKLVTCSSDKTIRLWDVPSGNLIRTFAGHSREITGVAFSPEDDRIVSTSIDRTARVWNLKGEEILLCQGHFDSVNTARFSSDSSEIITGSNDKTIRIWNGDTKSSTSSIRGHQNVVWSADFLGNGKTVVSASEDKTVTVTDFSTGKVGKKRFDLNSEVLSIAYEPVSGVVFAGTADNLIRSLNIDTGEMIELAGHDGYVWDLATSPDGKWLASASSDRSVRIWRISDLSVVDVIKDHDGELASVRFSNCGKFLITASDDKTIKLIDTSSFEVIHTFTGHQNGIWRAIFSPDSKRIASSSQSGQIIVWDVETKEQIVNYNAHSNQIAGLAFTHDGTRLVSAGDDRMLKIWQYESEIELLVLRDPGYQPIVHASFSPDGMHLVSGNGKGWITVRSAKNSSSTEQPFLPNDAVEQTIHGLLLVTADSANETTYRQQLVIAKKCAEHYPSYENLTLLGICLYRVGQYQAAKVALIEADRIEPILYGEPDLRPDIEGYLAMVHFRLSEFERAEAMRTEYREKCTNRIWLGDQQVLRLRKEMDSLFSSRQ